MTQRRLSVVLHTHMPYVEGFGTWPFGEEWLWEAMATCYLPLLDVLDAAPGRVTVSLTPVLADQLAAPGVSERFVQFLSGVREESHALDLEAHPEVAPQIEHSLARYRAAAATAGERDLLGALATHVTWTSSATHAVLPLLATDWGLDLQIDTGLASHRSRFGEPAGFWLPECAHAPWVLDRLEGVTCVELTDHDHDPRQALRAHPGLVLAPIDRALIDLVWGADGYPSRGAYLDTRRYTERRHLAWAVSGEPYDPDRAREQVAADAADFVARVPAGSSVVAIDTELLGHWWAEGVDWLAAVIAECDRDGVDLRPLDADYGHDAVPAGELPITSWGRPRTLDTWSGPRAAGLAWRQRAAELRVAAHPEPGPRALRELLALQSSDWAFLIAEDTSGPYPRERADLHERCLSDALRGGAHADPGLRNLAPLLGEI